MRSFSLFAVTTAILLPTHANAEEAQASVVLSSSQSFSIKGSEENCLLAHKAEDNLEEINVSLAEKATGNNGEGKSLRVKIGADETGYIDELQIGHGALNFQSLTPAGKISMEAEANFDQLTDDEYFAELDKAEAAAEQRTPGFDAGTVTVNGQTFSDYVKEIRANEKFPPLRTATVSVQLTDISMVEVSEGATIVTAGVVYEGPCKIAIMIE